MLQQRGKVMIKVKAHGCRICNRIYNADFLNKLEATKIRELPCGHKLKYLSYKFFPIETNEVPNGE
jgi:hypothetical protein